MARKLIDNVPIHQLQYPGEGQNYVFNGCMKFLMECLGEDEAYDYWFFSAVSGDAYVQVFGTDKSKWHACFSDSKFDYALIKRVFDSIGYDFTYLSAEDWRGDKEKCRAKLKEYIDRGIPVLGRGFYHTPPEGGEAWPTDEVSLIVGYENNGEVFYRLPEEATNLMPFTLDDPMAYTFVFIKGKKDAPPVADAYRNALLNAPQLMRTPPGKDLFFGNDAFEKWAQMLEGDFYHIPREEFEALNSIAQWHYYCIYMCMVSTNIFSKRHTTDRALEMNPELAGIAHALEREYSALKKLEQKLEKEKGGFSVTYEVLQDAKQCKKIAGILRLFPEVYTRICGIIESFSIGSNPQ